MTNVTDRPPSVAPFRNPNTSTSARAANVILGVLLFISAFILPHTSASRTNTWILGVLIAAFAGITSGAPQMRWVNAVLAIWLFFSTLWLRHISAGAVWNNLIVAVVVFILSLIPSRGRTTLR